MPTSRDIISSTAGAYGIPDWIPVSIAEWESSMQTTQDIVDTNGQHSTGLFQLNQAGLGKGHSISDLKKASINSEIAIPAMVPAYKEGVAKGLQGTDLLDYVANNSGWPGNGGVAVIQHTEPGYDVGLNKAYGKISGDYIDPTSGTPTTPNLLQTGSVAIDTGNLGILFHGQKVPWFRFVVVIGGVILAILAIYRIATK